MTLLPFVMSMAHMPRGDPQSALLPQYLWHDASVPPRHT